MDSQVNELLTRSVDDRGAERAVQIRRQQARERAALQADIAKSQAEIAALNQQRAPVAAELRKVEAEVGPIKYIAALIYGDDPDANLLEKAVRWVIILLVVVFDPLAIMMVLAATESIKWRRETPAEPAYPPDDGPLTNDQLDQIQATAPEPVYDPDTANALIAEIEPQVPEPVLPKKTLAEQHPYVNKEFAHFKDLKPIVAPVPTDPAAADEPDEHELPHVKEAIKKWKTANPGDTIKNQRHMLARGEIVELPWMALIESLPEYQSVHGFGAQLPNLGNKGDTYIRTDSVPNRLFKHNGRVWIELDKTISDSYTYDTAYIDYLIDKIARGEYDPDLLSESESEQVALRLQERQ
jgi:hypothetical protein